MAGAMSRAIRGIESPTITGRDFTGRKSNAYVTSWPPLILAPQPPPLHETGSRFDGHSRRNPPAPRRLVSLRLAEHDPDVPTLRDQKLRGFLPGSAPGPILRSREQAAISQDTPPSPCAGRSGRHNKDTYARRFRNTSTPSGQR